MPIILSLLLVSASPGLDDHYSAAFHACLATGAAAQGQTAAQVACTLAERKRQDRLLNKAYRLAMARRDRAGRAALRREERAWIERRDAKCDAAYRQTGGTLDQVLGASCDLAQTTRRRLYLERLPR